MAGRPAEIQPGTAEWEQLARWCLPPPRGEGLEAKAAHLRALAQGWTCSYHALYRARKRLLEQAGPLPAPSGAVLETMLVAHPDLLTAAPRRRFTL